MHTQYITAVRYVRTASEKRFVSPCVSAKYGYVQVAALLQMINTFHHGRQVRALARKFFFQFCSLKVSKIQGAVFAVDVENTHLTSRGSL